MYRSFFGMFALAYAFAPLYNLFCKITGFDGTTQVAQAAPHKILKRQVKLLSHLRQPKI